MPSEWNVNIDQYINPFLLSPRQQCFPPVIRRFIGNRDQPPRPLGNVFAVIWCFIGTLAALSLVFAVSKQIPGLESRDAPLILGSFVSLPLLPPPPTSLSGVLLTPGTREPPQCSSSTPSTPRSPSHATRC